MMSSSRRQATDRARPAGGRWEPFVEGRTYYFGRETDQGVVTQRIQLFIDTNASELTWYFHPVVCEEWEVMMSYDFFDPEIYLSLPFTYSPFAAFRYDDVLEFLSGFAEQFQIGRIGNVSRGTGGVQNEFSVVFSSVFRGDFRLIGIIAGR